MELQKTGELQLQKIGENRFAIYKWTPEKFIQEAEQVHQDVARYISQVLGHKSYPEQAYKSCSGILSFVRRVGPERLANACRWADSLGQYNYPVIEEILRKQLDQLQPEGEQTAIPSHKNIRGKELPITTHKSEKNNE